MMQLKLKTKLMNLINNESSCHPLQKNFPNMFSNELKCRRYCYLMNNNFHLFISYHTFQFFFFFSFPMPLFICDIINLHK